MDNYHIIFSLEKDSGQTNMRDRYFCSYEWFRVDSRHLEWASADKYCSQSVKEKNKHVSK